MNWSLICNSKIGYLLEYKVNVEVRRQVVESEVLPVETHVGEQV